jgi:hypothetical protein
VRDRPDQLVLAKNGSALFLLRTQVSLGRNRRQWQTGYELIYEYDMNAIAAGH